MSARLAVQLSPDLSRRVLALVEHKRKATGWTRGQLAQKANAQRGELPEFTTNLLDVRHRKARRGVPLRLDLGKALVLLATCGHGSNRADRLVAELSDEIASLIADAEDMARSAP